MDYLEAAQDEQSYDHEEYCLCAAVMTRCMGISLCPECDKSKVIRASDFMSPGLAVYFRFAPMRDDAEAEGAQGRENTEVFIRNRLQVADNASGSPITNRLGT